MDLTCFKGSKAYEYGETTKWAADHYTPHYMESVPTTWFDEDYVPTLTLPEEVTKVETSALRDHAELTTATMDGVTEIEASAFQGSGVVNVSIPKIQTIGASAFASSKAKNVTFGDDLETIGASAFANSKFTGVLNIPYGTKTIGANAFENCTGITQVNIPDTVTSVGANAFKGCTGIQRVIFLGRDEYPTEIVDPNAFVSLSPALVYIDGQSKYSCIKDEVGVSTDLMQLTATDRGHSIKGYSANPDGSGDLITSLEGFDGENLYAVWEDAKIEQKDEHTYIAHYGVNKIEAGTFASIDTKNGNEFTVIFRNPNTEIEVNAFSPATQNVNFESYKDSPASAYGSTLNGGVQWCNVTPKTELTEADMTTELVPSLIIKKGIDSIGDNAFTDHQELKSISLRGVKTIGTGAFKDDAGLVSLSLNGTETIGENAFLNCTELTGELSLPNGLKTIGAHAFENDAKVVGTLIIPASVTDIGADAFKGTGIERVICLGEQRPNGLRDAFTNLTENAIQNGVTFNGKVLNATEVALLDSPAVIIIGDECEEIADEAFKDNTDIKSIDCSGATALKRIGDSAFEGSGLISIDLSGAPLEEVGNRAFAGTSIPSIVFPETTTTMGESVFEGCSGLVSADLGGVTDLPKNTFKDCQSLENVANTENLTNIGDSAFENSGIKSIVTGEGLNGIGTDAFKDSELKEITITNPDISITGTGIGGEVKITADTGSRVEEEAHTNGNPINTDTGRKVYTITLDDNGGTGGSGTIRVFQGQPLNKVDRPTKPKMGFTGYYNTKEGGTQYFDENGNGKITFTGVKNTTLYANWSDAKVTLKFNPNGGGGTLTSEKVLLKDTLTLPTTTTFTAPEGKQFAGWSTSASNPTTTKTYNASECKDGDIINFYAQWEEKKLIVNYNSNGGTGMIASQTFPKNGTVTLASGDTLTRTGYGFVGWGRTAQSTPVAASMVLDASVIEEREITLYAVWKEVAYTVVYSGNGGGGTMEPQNIGVGVFAQLSRCIYTPPAGKTFGGWAMTPSGIKMYDDMQYVRDLAQDGGYVTLFALWVDDANANNNNGGSNNRGGSEGGNGNNSGGSSNNSGNSSGDSNGNSSGDSQKAAQMYILTYDVNGGTGAVAPAIAGSDGKVKITDVMPTKANQTFLGWGIKPDATVAQYKAGETITMSANTTLYAIYAAAGDVTYTFVTKTHVMEKETPSADVTYETIGSETYKVTSKKASGKAGANVEIVAGKDFTVEDGYELDGKSVLKGTISDKLELVVIFNRKKYDVVYDSNCSDSNVTVPSKITDYWGKVVTLSTEKPVRKNYEFGGWTTDKNSKISVPTITIAKAPTTVYAIWTGLGETVSPEGVTKVPEGTTYKLTADGTIMVVKYPTGKTDTVNLADLGYVLEAGKETTVVFDSNVYGEKRSIVVKMEGSNSNITDVAVQKGITYEVIKGTNNVAISNLADKASLVIGGTMTINGKTFKVTKIAESAGEGLTKLTNLVIGKNITSIGANAFNGDKKLRSIIFKTKKCSIGKGAFRNINKKAKFKLSGSKANKKAMKRTVQKSTTGYKKTMTVK